MIFPELFAYFQRNSTCSNFKVQNVIFAYFQIIQNQVPVAVGYNVHFIRQQIKILVYINMLHF